MRSFSNNIVLKIIICLAIFTSIGFAQDTQSNEEELILLRAESLLQTIRDENWFLLYDFVVVSTGKKDAETKSRLNIKDDDSDYDKRKKVGQFFKSVYGVVKPGKIVRPVRYWDKEKTLVGIGYRHGDLDGFYMRKVDEEWYYTLDYK